MMLSILITLKNTKKEPVNEKLEMTSIRSTVRLWFKSSGIYITNESKKILCACGKI